MNGKTHDAVGLPEHASIQKECTNTGEEETKRILKENNATTDALRSRKREK